MCSAPSPTTWGALPYVELTGSDPVEVARKVKAVIADGLATEKAQPGITVKSCGTQPYPMARGTAMMASAEAAPMPVEAGESNVTVNVSGQIELLD